MTTSTESVSAPPSAADVATIPSEDPDKKLRRHLGFWQLSALSFTGIVGSGWLFGAYYAAQAAGPAALVSWVIGGFALLLTALVLAELGGTLPLAAAEIRWPLIALGSVVATVIGWAAFLFIGAGSAAETTAVIQYTAHYWPQLQNGGTGLLSPLGVLVAALLLAVLIAFNWFGVRLLGRVNLAITIFKVAVPVATIVLLFASGFHTGNFTGHGGFAPYGWSAALSAVSGAGIVYSYQGFNTPVDLAGETANPKRNVPRAILASFFAAAVIYLGLQLAFIGAVPAHLLGHGWNGLDFNSPFAQLAVILNLGWFAALLYLDAIVSPSGSILGGLAVSSRYTYGLARIGLLPRAIAHVHGRSGITRRALAVNFVLALIFLVPFKSWQDIVAVGGVLILISYSAVSTVIVTFARSPHFPLKLAGWVPRIKPIALVSFIVSTVVIYWTGWNNLKIVAPVLLFGFLLHAALHASRKRFNLRDYRFGAWLAVYLGTIWLLSAIGAKTFGGAGILPQPWDSIILAAVSVPIFEWSVRSGLANLAANNDFPELAAAQVLEETEPAATAP
jgi:amino acid transporter